MTTRVGPTEDTPATPSWVERRLDEIVAALPEPLRPAMERERGRYLDCLAGTAGPEDPLIGRQRCHQSLMQRLRAGEPDVGARDDAALDQLHRTLEALEAELASGT